MGTTESMWRNTRRDDEELIDTSNTSNAKLLHDKEYTNRDVGLAIRRLLENQDDITRRLREIGSINRITLLSKIGRIITEKLETEKTKELIGELARKTGYSQENLRQDLGFITHVLNERTLREVIDKGLIGGSRSLDEPVLHGHDEYIYNAPIGSVYIIASGNSVVPPLIPTVISLVIGNLTILRPSTINYEAIALFREALLEAVATGERDADVISNGFALLYLRHDDPLFDELLTSYPLSLVNYWGGEPGRTRVSLLIAKNPHRPKLVINGPLTGIAVIDEESINNESVMDKIALETVLYEQQLCSSPTFLFFIGRRDAMQTLIERLRISLDKIGDKYSIDVTEGYSYRSISIYKKLIMSDIDTVFSMKPSNPWLLITHNKDSKWPASQVSFHERRRTLEIVQLTSIDELPIAMDKLEEWLEKHGVDGIQTISYDLSQTNFDKLIRIAMTRGTYRVVPIGESFLRTPSEPYDGEFMPMSFSRTLYMRRKGALGERR